ncbi:MAG: N-acetylmuramoyl-L-alanine amidase [Ruminococcus sp.]|nr:N-acetylmuramoyl-L-alanine amidase [Ruminococcus sp.]
MTDEEFYQIYGRMPRRSGPKKRKVKVYWGRVIIALVLLILLIVGIVKLIGLIVGKVKGSGKEDSSSSSSVSSAADKDDSSIAKVITTAPEEEAPAESPQKVTRGNISLTVCIDPAHGGDDDGSQDPSGMRLEKDDTLSIALKLRDYLESQGVTVYMTRTDDVFVDQAGRVSTAVNNRADLMITLHRGYAEGNYNGIEAYVGHEKPATDTRFAGDILAALKAVGTGTDHGVKYGYVNDKQVDYYINENTPMPSVLLNIGYISDDGDNSLFTQNADAYARAIGDAVIDSAYELGVIGADGSRSMSGQLKSEKTTAPDIQVPEENTGDQEGAYNDDTGETEQYGEEEPEYTDDGMGQYTEPMMTDY